MSEAMALREKIVDELNRYMVVAETPRTFADRILAIIQAEHAIVPKEPSDEMTDAGLNRASGDMNGGDVDRVYRAMLAAAPKAQP